MMDEFFPIVNEAGEVLGKTTRKQCHNGKDFILHPVVHLHIFNSKGELLLQKRSLNKDIQPGKWDTSVGGHIDYGEDVEAALRREVSEELGIKDFTPEFITSYVFTSSVEKELVYVHKTIYDGEIIFDPVEIDEIRFWSIDEILSEIKAHPSTFTENFRNEFLIHASATKSKKCLNLYIDIKILDTLNI